MRKTSLLIPFAAAALVASAATGIDTTLQVRQLVQSAAPKKVSRANVAQAAFKAAPLKHTPMKAEGKSEAILIDEDFSAFTSGTTEKPDTTQMLASEYTSQAANGIFIDNVLTKDGTWFGNKVYSAGGAIALKTYNPQSQAYICTPIGDYSGDITVTLRAKGLPALVNGENEGEYVELTGSGLGIQACTGGYNGQAEANTDDESGYYSVRLYRDKGWQKITYTFKNFSSNNDGYICFYTEGAVVIDDVQITAGHSFLANPTMKGITDFQKDNFTIEWEPTRDAYNYYVDLYTRQYKSDKDTTFVEDFEDGQLGEGWSSTSTTYTDNEGEDATKGLVLKNGDSFTTPTTGNDLKSLHFYLQSFDPTVDPNDPYAKYYVQGSVLIDLKTVNGWKNIGEYYANGFYGEGDMVRLEDEYSKFVTGGFQQLRLRVEDMNDGAYFVLDNVDAVAKPAFEYQIVNSDYDTDLSSPYAYTASTKKTSYTFTGLDPVADYYYGVRSHLVSQFSDRNYFHALGIAAPEATTATDIDSRGSFTANWQPVPKATSYTVACYGAKKMEKDVEDYALLEEDFSGVTGEATDDPYAATPLNNKQQSPLDSYTNYPGWTGKYNTIAEGMIGGDGDGDYIFGNVTTPEIQFTSADAAKVTMKAYGEPGDNFAIKCNGTLYYLAIPESGAIDGDFMLPITDKRQSIRFSSANGYPFLIDYLKVSQDMKKGDIALTWLGQATTDAETTSYTFDGLYDYDFSQFAYRVIANYQYDDNNSVSSLKPSDIVLVDLASGTSTGINDLASKQNVKVVARYSVDGSRIYAPVKGVNIVKMSDGTTRKVIVK